MASHGKSSAPPASSEDGYKTVTASAISYKKRTKAPTETPNASQDRLAPSVPSGPSTPDPSELPGPAPTGTRKILSRRKALQDYYKLQGEEQGDRPGEEQGKDKQGDKQGKNEHGEADKRNGENHGAQGLGGGRAESLGEGREEDRGEVRAEGGAGQGDGGALQDRAELENRENGTQQRIGQEKEGEEGRLARALANKDTFAASLKHASIRELVRTRNWANNRLNHHDMEKKSIIYDNYSDLIKLNDVLSDINQERHPADAFGSGPAPATNQDVDAYLNDVAAFLKSDAAVFNQDFVSVVQALCDDIDDADSIASIKALKG